jgi:hypothetical protein
MSHDPIPLAQTAYAAYGESTGHLNFQGLPMPSWDELGESIQRAWAAAADAVVQAVTTSTPTSDRSAPARLAASRPSMGRIVLVSIDPSLNNGADVAPAVICRIWSDTTINVRVLGDGPAIEWRTSLTYSPELGAPDLAAANAMGRWTWPPRV